MILRYEKGKYVSNEKEIKSSYENGRLMHKIYNMMCK